MGKQTSRETLHHPSSARGSPTFPFATSNIAMELVRPGSRGAGCGAWRAARSPVVPLGLHRLGIPGLQPAAVKPSVVLQL